MKEKKLYRYSRLILFLISFILFQLICINEDNSLKVIGFAFSVFTYLFSFISSIFSKKIIYFGDKLKTAKKVLYYLAFIPALSVVIFIYFIIGYLIVSPIVDNMHGWDGLGLFIVFLGTVIVFGIIVILPYLQALIVLTVRNLLITQQIWGRDLC